MRRTLSSLAAVAIVVALVAGTMLVRAQVHAGAMNCDGPVLLLDVDRCAGSTTLAPGYVHECVGGAHRLVLKGCVTPDGVRFVGWEETAIQPQQQAK